MRISKIVGAGGIAFTSVFAALAWVSGPAIGQTSSAAANWEAMTKCGAMANDDARHACSDEVLRKAGLLKSAEAKPSSKPSGPSETQKTAEKPQKAAHEPQTASVAEPPEVPSSFAPKPRREKKSRRSNRIEVTLAKAVKRGDGKLDLTTTDGAVWRQLFINALLPTPAAGASMKVEKNDFGGFMCRIGKWPAFRCKPIS